MNLEINNAFPIEAEKNLLAFVSNALKTKSRINEFLFQYKQDSYVIGISTELRNRHWFFRRKESNIIVQEFKIGRRGARNISDEIINFFNSKILDKDVTWIRNIEENKKWENFTHTILVIIGILIICWPVDILIIAWFFL